MSADPNDPRIVALNAKLGEHSMWEQRLKRVKSDKTKAWAALLVASVALTGTLIDSRAVKAVAAGLGMLLPAAYLVCIWVMPRKIRDAVRVMDPEHKRRGKKR